ALDDAKLPSEATGAVAERAVSTRRDPTSDVETPRAAAPVADGVGSPPSIPRPFPTAAFAPAPVEPPRLGLAPAQEGPPALWDQMVAPAAPVSRPPTIPPLEGNTLAGLGIALPLERAHPAAPEPGAASAPAEPPPAASAPAASAPPEWAAREPTTPEGAAAPGEPGRAVAAPA